jgi:hypothetical protein
MHVAIIAACMGKMRNVYRILVIKGKIPLRGTGHRWKDNIEMDLQEMSWTGFI